MLRKTVPAGLAVGALFALAACGSSSDSGTDGASAGGVKTGPGISDSAINIGIFTDYSGPIAAAASLGSAGMEVYFDEVNDNGGVCGRKINVVKGDTKYDTQTAVQVYRANVNNLAMIGQLLGTDSIVALQSDIQRDNIPTISISLSTPVLKMPDVYVPYTPFEIELANGVAWAAQEAKASDSNPLKLAYIVPSDDYGKVYADVIKSVAADTPGVQMVAETTYTTGDKDFTAQVTQMKQAGAQVVMIGTSPAEIAGVIGTAAQLGYKPKFVSESGSWSAQLAEPLKGLLDNTFVSGGYGSLTDDAPGITELKADMQKYAPDDPANNFEVGGYLSGLTTVAALQKACDDGDLSRQGIINAMQNLKVGYQGIADDIDLGTGDTIVSYSSRINKIAPDGSLVPITDFFASDAAKKWGADNGL